MPQPRFLLRQWATPLVAVGLLAATLAAADIRPATRSDLADCRLTARARQALAQDGALASHNVGVTVQSGVATLWGSVPSAGLAQRAQDRVRRVEGMLDVRNELQVQTSDDPMLEFLNTPTAKGQPRLSELLAPGTHRAMAIFTSHADFADPAATAVAEGPPGNAGLLPPIAVPQTQQSSDLSMVVERLCRQNPRLAGLRAEVQKGVVRLQGTVTSWEDLHQLARVIAHLPGVERVILDNVRSER